MRVLLDTNVLIAAFASRGLCEDVLRTVLTEHELVVSEFILDEVSRVLEKKLKMPSRERISVIRFLRDISDVIDPSKPAAWPSEDPDDQWVVAAAIVGEVDVLITGDSDLTKPPEDVTVRILTPRGFWELLR